MLKQKNHVHGFLSIVLCMVFVLCCFVGAALTSSAATGADYADDTAAVAAGCSFRVDGKYYSNLVDCYDAVPEGGTIYMIADYISPTSTCESVGKSASAAKSFTIQGNNYTYNAQSNHSLHFYNSKVTIDGMNYFVKYEWAAGMRVECNAEVTLKNCTFEKNENSTNDWNPPVIVYGTLILDQGAVVKNNSEKASVKSLSLIHI